MPSDLRVSSPARLRTQAPESGASSARLLRVLDSHRVRSNEVVRGGESRRRKTSRLVGGIYGEKVRRAPRSSRAAKPLALGIDHRKDRSGGPMT